jgi:hypothetical protein
LADSDSARLICVHFDSFWVLEVPSVCFRRRRPNALPRIYRVFPQQIHDNRFSFRFGGKFGVGAVNLIVGSAKIAVGLLSSSPSQRFAAYLSRFSAANGLVVVVKLWFLVRRSQIHQLPS